MRLALVLFLVTVTVSVRAEWVEYGSGFFPISSYYDPTTIKKRMMSGEIDGKNTFVGPEEWKDTVPDSAHGRLQSIVCK
jgi:hypothetical protein